VNFTSSMDLRIRDRTIARGCAIGDGRGEAGPAGPGINAFTLSHHLEPCSRQAGRKMTSRIPRSLLYQVRLFLVFSTVINHATELGKPHRESRLPIGHHQLLINRLRLRSCPPGLPTVAVRWGPQSAPVGRFTFPSLSAC